METIAELFGFTTVAGGIWNAVSYAAFIAIIIGVFYERHRTALVVIGAGTLALYAGFFLHNILFTALQALIVVSGLLQWTKTPRSIAMTAMTLLTILAYALLAASGVLTDRWALAGSLGLLGIAFGLIALPARSGFWLMAAGGVLLVLYAYTVHAWVFFGLNIVFAVANIIELWRRPQNVA